MSDSDDVLVQRYGALLDESELFGLAFCWTVLVDAADEVSVLSALSARTVEVLGMVSLDDAVQTSYEVEDENQTVAWLVSGAGWVGVLEFAGYAGSSQETLLALSAVATRVASLCWQEANGRCTLSVAQDDEAKSVELDALDLIDLDEATLTLSDALQPLLTGNVDDVRAVGLAAVERATGAALSEPVLSGSWPLLRFDMRTEVRQIQDRDRPGGNQLVMDNEFDLFDALEDATPAARLAAQTTLVDTLLAAKTLTSEPGVQAIAEALARGERPGPSPELWSLMERVNATYTVTRKGFSDHSAWQRSRAVQTLFEFANPHAESTPEPRPDLPFLGRSPSRYNGWNQARLALGDEAWPAARERALTQLRAQRNAT